jgi:hypothetical protein
VLESSLCRKPRFVVNSRHFASYRLRRWNVLLREFGLQDPHYLVARIADAHRLIEGKRLYAALAANRPATWAMHTALRCRTIYSMNKQRIT